MTLHQCNAKIHARKSHYSKRRCETVINFMKAKKRAFERSNDSQVSFLFDS